MKMSKVIDGFECPRILETVDTGTRARSIEADAQWRAPCSSAFGVRLLPRIG